MSIRPKHTDALLFLDETGTGSYLKPRVLEAQKALVSAGKRPTTSTIFGLGGVLIRRADYVVFQRSMAALRRKHFGRSDFLLHEYHLRSMDIEPFDKLRDEALWLRFYADLGALIAATDMRVIVATVDKIAMPERYPEPYHAYQYSFHVILERVINEKSFGTTCRVVAENRQAGLNNELRNEMLHLQFNGGSVDGEPTVSAEEVQAKFDPAIVFRTKSDLDAGLEIADLAAGPVTRWLHDLKMSPTRNVLPIIQPKLRRSASGRIRGYGAICLPWFPVGCPA